MHKKFKRISLFMLSKLVASDGLKGSDNNNANISIGFRWQYCHIVADSHLIFKVYVIMPNVSATMCCTAMNGHYFIKLISFFILSILYARLLVFLVILFSLSLSINSRNVIYFDGDALDWWNLWMCNPKLLYLSHNLIFCCKHIY